MFLVSLQNMYFRKQNKFYSKYHKVDYNERLNSIFKVIHRDRSYLNPAKNDGPVFEVDSSSHRVDDRLRLLEDLLQHERVERTFHDLLDLHLQRRDFSERGK